MPRIKGGSAADSGRITKDRRRRRRTPRLARAASRLITQDPRAGGTGFWCVAGLAPAGVPAGLGPWSGRRRPADRRPAALWPSPRARLGAALAARPTKVESFNGIFGPGGGARQGPLPFGALSRSALRALRSRPHASLSSWKLISVPSAAAESAVAGAGAVATVVTRPVLSRPRRAESPRIKFAALAFTDQECV